MDAYFGEIRIFGGNYAPMNWALCDGSLLSIQDYQALFTLIGTTYGGDGVNTFALPNLMGRLALGAGQGPGLSTYTMGQTVGSYSVTLEAETTPQHTHGFVASQTTATSQSPGDNMYAALPSGYKSYVPSTATGSTARPLDSATLTSVGAGQPHANVMPSLGLSYIICLQGTYPQFP